MHYYKCPVCGNFNEIANEDVSYCSVCTARYENSYKNWKQLNPDGNFKDYLKKFCVDEKTMEAEVGDKYKYEVKVQRRSWRPFVLAVLFVLLVIIGLIMGGIIRVPYLYSITSLFA